MSSATEKDGDNKETTLENVHSANSWETADLGDKQRNEKFLRLMGAAKKEHHGKIVIGDHNPSLAHKRGRREEQHLEDDLAEQYEQSLEHRLASGKRGHLGLGYRPESESDPETKNEEEEESAVVAKPEEDKAEDDDEEENAGDEEKDASRKSSVTKINEKSQGGKGDENNSNEDSPEPEVKKKKCSKDSS
ncbi:unnamed protein product [Lymnaea stagnalis]|uniref:Small acidic protein n=1 Tax=Lymnaea stagnalis TaxID=6523 RepID=A0AAV2HE49_LYMST